MSAVLRWRSDPAEDEIATSVTDYRPPRKISRGGAHSWLGTSAETTEEASDRMIPASVEDFEDLVAKFAVAYMSTMWYGTGTEVSLGTAQYAAFEGVLAPESVLPKRHYGSWVLAGLGILCLAVFLLSFVSMTSATVNLINPRFAALVVLASFALMVETVVAILLRRRTQ